MPIEKGIVDIKVANSPPAIECNAKHNSDEDGIDHRAKSLVKVNSLLLVKTFSNKPSFIPSNRVIEIEFDAKRPYVCPQYSTSGSREQETKYHSR